MMMKKILIAAPLGMLGAIPIPSTAHDDTGAKSCLVNACAAGDHGVTYATKAEPYYACPTRELAEYTNFVLGLLSVSAQLTGHMPNISDKTGDPEYRDSPAGPNKTRLMLDALRKAAKVSTFDQATGMCTKGASNLRVVVMNSSDDTSAIWVGNERGKTFFWMPKSNLDKK